MTKKTNHLLLKALASLCMSEVSAILQPGDSQARVLLCILLAQSQLCGIEDSEGGPQPKF